MEWLTSPLTAIVLLVAAGVFAGLAGVFFFLWRQGGPTKFSSDPEVFQAEHDRIDQELRLAELGDRLRFITDVHTAAAASLTELISRAEGASFAATTDPEAAARAARGIADDARVVLSDLRRVVNVAGEDKASGQADPSVLALSDLFDAMEKSGMIIQFEEAGESFPIGSSAELAIFRILQEALNNCRQHGGAGTTVKVGMTWSKQGLAIRVDDDGIRTQNRARQEAGEDTAYTVEDDQRALVDVLDGRGMRDMKSRTEAYGGVFSAHRIPGVGLSLSAAFPTLRFHNGIHGVDVRGGSEASPS
jgi:signal transduction histidine kinase